MKKNFAICLAGASLAALIGCAPSVETRHYSVYVTNQMSDPVTVFLTKDGPPVERGWLSPEELAAAPVNDTPIDSGRVVGPKFTAGATNLTGKFEAHTQAVLRFYHLTGHLEDFAAVSRGSPRRVEVVLHPGDNAFIVTGNEDAFQVSPSAVPAASPSGAATRP